MQQASKTVIHQQMAGEHRNKRNNITDIHMAKEAEAEDALAPEEEKTKIFRGERFEYINFTFIICKSL